MSFLENIFGKVHDYFERISHDDANTFYPDFEKVSILGKILFKKNTSIKISEIKIGLDSRNLYLPPFSNFFDDLEKNKLLFEFRIYLFYALSYFYSEKKAGEDSATPLKFLPMAWSFLKKEFPRIEEKFSPILPTGEIREYMDGKSNLPIGQWGLIYCGTFYESETKNVVNDLSFGQKTSGKDYSIEKTGEAEIVEVKKKNNGENPLVHNFEKLKTAEEFFGGDKTFDGSDEMADQLNALKDLKWNKVVRTPEKSESFLKMDLTRNGEGFEITNEEPVLSKVTLFKYPEYHFAKGKSLENWCHVYEGREIVSSPYPKSTELKKIIDKLKSELIYRIFSRRYRNRQLAGEEIDFDSLVDFRADMKHGGVFSDRLFLKKKNTFQDISIFFLLDLSQSMDSWKNGKRILDMATDGLFILGEVFSDLVPIMGIGGFYSLTRKNCQFKILKSFEETWDFGKKKIYGLKTEGHTRIGPAIRHAHYLLNKTNSKRRLLVILTDGKPIDYDRYEGTYGEKDIHMAITEGRKNGISTFAFAFEKDSGQSFNKMFGPNYFEIVKKPSEIGGKFLDFVASKQ